ncbi:SUKH superfamily protein [Roseimicrobium gellanilyticum]|uniref:SUKH superfamily protein n=2 Tax=Roseimicrobium gellanilyticum TaxID=748857 RepID=A0A366H8W7_9BACT|nr:SUKH superfamily protein [Roseimicrobium gellanilyticum]
MGLSADIAMQFCGRQITAAELDAFEGRHGVSLPKGYRKFMRAYNGGMVSPLAHFTFLDRDYCLHSLYSLNDNFPYELDRMCKSLNWEMAYSLGHLCFGRDPGGSEFFIATRGPDSGAIHFVDREEALGLGVVRIADSFRQLMEGLVPA